jgi:Ino eighty subunit 1
MTSRDPSPAPSEGDTIDDQNEDVKPDVADLDQDIDPDQSHLTEDQPITRTPGSSRRGGRSKTASGRKGKPRKGASAIWIQEQPNDGTEDEGSVISTSYSRTKKSEASPESEPRTVGTAVGTRRQANGTVGSVYSGSKIRHIKKPDGTPLWRKEIQYEFLRIVIEDTKPVFTRISDGKTQCNFADIYVDCMARSSKTSKILKDRLQVDRQAAQNMAMICLLVNVGRMNTTLNFFPEMRAQLRTYHSIPSLQAYKSQRDYKSLQDAPRLKSILKGASEDTDEPRTMLAIKSKSVPRTNPVNLIFVLSQFAPKVSETHFTDKVDFFDMAMRHTISSASRARAFLWLMWWYLESNFTKEDGLNNPFGPGEYKEDEDPDDPDTVPQLVPKLINITPEEGDAENEDPEEEIRFAEKMTKERKRIMEEVANEPPLVMADPSNPDHKLLKRLKKSALYGDDDSLMSDGDSRASPGIGRSPIPDPGPHGHIMSALGGQADSLDDDWDAVDPHPGRGRYKRVRGKNTPTRTRGGGRHSDGPRSLLKSSRRVGTPDTVERYRGTPQPLQPGQSKIIMVCLDANKCTGRLNETPSGGTLIKSRARTGYQRELEEHRMRRVEWALRRRRRDAYKVFEQAREGERWLLKAARRISELPPTYDSEEEEENGSVGFAGILARRWNGEPVEGEPGGIPSGYEPEDYGEEAEVWTRLTRRTARRLELWGGDRDLSVYTARVQKIPQAVVEEITRVPAGRSVTNGSTRKAAPKRRDRSVDVEPPTATPVESTAKGTITVKSPEIRSGRDLNDEITQDLLAERSDEDMDGEGDASADEVDGEGEGDHENGNEESDVEMD